LSVPDEGYSRLSNLSILSVPDEGYSRLSNLSILSVPDEGYYVPERLESLE
jgi:predicted DNA-binding protein